MAKLPTQKYISREDLKEAPAWIERLLYPINSFMQSVAQALQKNLTFEENIACAVKEYRFQTPATYPTDMPFIRFSTDMKRKPRGLILLKVGLYAAEAEPTGEATVSWAESEGVVTITAISGLAASKDYIARFLVI